MAQHGKRYAAWLLALGLGLFAGPVLAQVPGQSIRPLARPLAEAAVPAPLTSSTGLPMMMVAPLGVPPGLRSFVPDAALAELPRPQRRPGADPAPALPRADVAQLGIPPALASHVPDPVADAAGPPRQRPAPATVTGWADVAPLGPRPRQRSARAAAPVQVATASVVPMAALGERLVAALRPEPRPRNLARRAAAAAPPPEQLQAAAVIRPAPGTGPVGGRRGALCGVPGLQGETLSAIAGAVRGCGIANPVRVTSVGNIRLSQPATMDCDTARALHTWVERGLKPAFARTGGGVTGMQVAGHYVCRTRNHRAGARISEHGKGKAIDISGLTLANGQRLSILRDWRGSHGAQLKIAHRAACGIFGTTLGPGSDGMHEDHLHFDTARHRNGSYCR